MDAVLFFKFENENEVTRRFRHLPKFTPLVAVNLYFNSAQSGLTKGTEIDIIPGPNSSGMWKSFAPIIVNFVASDDDRPLVRYWENKFDAAIWIKVKELSVQYSRKFPGEARFGNFMAARLVTRDFSEKYFPHLHDDI